MYRRTREKGHMKDTDEEMKYQCRSNNYLWLIAAFQCKLKPKKKKKKKKNYSFYPPGLKINRGILR